MSKIILAFCLVLIGFLPSTENKTSLEEKIRKRIDSPHNVSESIPKREFQTAEYTEDFKKISTRARASYFVDITSGQVLVEKNSDTKLPVASITKLMTALIVIEQKEQNEVVTVPVVGTRFGDSTMGLSTGDRLTIYGLLQGLLINSGSDAALTLAKSTSGSETKFVALMNEKATILGLNNTQFTNPVGWDEPGHYSTAHDLATLTTVALKNPVIREIVATKTTHVLSTKGKRYLLTNTNLLLSSHFLGTKTGTTYAAGECLASYYVEDEKEIVGVVLNSPNRFLETNTLINQIKASFIFNNEKAF